MTGSAIDRGRVDVAIIGDGPAGSALAASLTRRGADVVLVGRGDPWHATYGSWIDDVEGIDLLSGIDPWERTLTSVDVVAVEHDTAADPHADAVLDLAGFDPMHRRVLGAGLVVDATGWPGRFVAPGISEADADAVPRQTAFGVVLDEPPPGQLGRPTLMDWSPVVGSPEPGAPTFAYALPVRDGWLVEETVLAASPAVAADHLLPRLAARLGTDVDALMSRAVRTERVDIPMGGPLPDRRSSVLAFGAAAAMIHPATGYSLAASLRRAGPVADVLVDMLADRVDRVDRGWEAIWPAGLRRTRALHDYGLDVLLALGADDVASFFAAFFELPERRWAPYLRIDTPPRTVAATMAALFARADWGLRRRLVSANPRGFVRLLRP